MTDTVQNYPRYISISDIMKPTYLNEHEQKAL